MQNWRNVGYTFEVQELVSWGIQPPKSQALLPPLPMTLLNPSPGPKTRLASPQDFLDQRMIRLAISCLGTLGSYNYPDV
ncbi:hypothetical protein FOCG_07073 [Fusarium oxysporum f. sp. radicis-lycopersici 26381]|uniref:Uncharacterized protein n=1 Tax=Fusarium oxysporum Fo47 TaxID=660027 RepID=W9KVW0_FUSOX|nr:hypothetical protein FOZG_04130 [Fusarium oxysporum Fo47]EWZ93691.1 hypothetical protein FOWG_06369 [Fusarium oxysporum f. sp. lycopersici MN25]EXL53956.1 hypothetical protein FOCG_07073 [Fusarium oxysporum f. sp. radicis-lycopersici 26381]KAK2482569.1 hypothetical protein H9L39_04361 [Fusarium oxysporum f. sp. albedinis]